MQHIAAPIRTTSVRSVETLAVVKHVKGKAFKGVRVRLDGNQYEGCTFEDCQIVYSGGKTSLVSCTIDRCRFTLEDEAINTLRFLSLLYQNPGAAAMVESWINDIKAGPPGTPTN